MIKWDGLIRNFSLQTQNSEPGTASMTSILDVQKVHSGYGKIEVLHGVSIHVEPMEIVCIIGPNGSGKSTLLKTVFGLIQPTTVTILFSEEDITHLESEEKVKRGMTYIPQG